MSFVILLPLRGIFHGNGRPRAPWTPHLLFCRRLVRQVCNGGNGPLQKGWGLPLARTRFFPVAAGLYFNGYFPACLGLGISLPRLIVAIPWLLIATLPAGAETLPVAVPVVTLAEVALLGTLHVLAASRSFAAFGLFAQTGRSAFGHHPGLSSFGLAFASVAAFLVKIIVLRTAQLLGRLAHRLGRRHHPEIMLGKLKVAFSHDIVAGRLRITAKLHVFLGDRLRRAPDFYVRPVALVNPVDRAAAATATVPAPAATRAAIAAAAAALAAVLSLTCAMSVIKVQIITSAKTAVPYC